MKEKKSLKCGWIDTLWFDFTRKKMLEIKSTTCEALSCAAANSSWAVTACKISKK